MVFTVVLAPAVLAQPQTFAINPDASTVHIKLNTTHEVVNGIFHLQSGSIDFDRTTSHVSGMVIVAAGSGKTGNDSRDKQMNNDILKVAQFATVSFAPKTYSGTIAASGDSTIQVSGVFTLLGTPHDLTIPMQIHIDGSKATAKGQFVIPYVEWGLKNPSFLIWKAENNVAIDLTLVGQISNKAATALTKTTLDPLDTYTQSITLAKLQAQSAALVGVGPSAGDGQTQELHTGHECKSLVL